MSLSLSPDLLRHWLLQNGVDLSYGILVSPHLVPRHTAAITEHPHSCHEDVIVKGRCDHNVGARGRLFKAKGVRRSRLGSYTY